MFAEVAEAREEIGRQRAKIAEQEAEIARLKKAICALADQDATLSIQDGNVIVDCGAPLLLSNEEREALESEVELAEYQQRHEAPTLRGLLERTKCTS